jgi:glycine cleavage system H protein
VNGALEDSPELVNNDPYGDGWLFMLQMSNPDEMEGLLTPEAYADLQED